MAKTKKASPAPVTAQPIEESTAPVMVEETPPPPAEEKQSGETFAPPSRTPVTQEIVNARFSKELTAIKYNEALQRFTDYKITSENIAEAQAKMKAVRGFIKTLGEIKDEGKRPALEECRFWDNAYKNILAPLQTLFASKEAELKKIVDAVAEENRKREQERQRVASIEKDIDNTLMQHAQNIANATTTEQLIAIEKLLGSQKANKSRFAELLPNFIERCGELTPLIKAQKEKIKELEDLAAQMAAAEKEQDDRKILELQEKQEEVKSQLEETKIVTQEVAIHQATRPDVVTAEAIPTQINYRRKSWKWKVNDIKELQKKAPHLIIVSPDEEKIDELLKTKKSDGSLKDVEEVNYLGITFYLEKLV